MHNVHQNDAFSCDQSALQQMSIPERGGILTLKERNQKQSTEFTGYLLATNTKTVVGNEVYN